MSSPAGNKLTKRIYGYVGDGHELAYSQCPVILATVGGTSKQRRDWKRWCETRLGVSVDDVQAFQPTKPGAVAVVHVFELRGTEEATAIACGPDIVEDAWQAISGVKIPRGGTGCGPEKVRPSAGKGKPRDRSMERPDRAGPPAGPVEVTEHLATLGLRG